MNNNPKTAKAAILVMVLLIAFVRFKVAFLLIFFIALDRLIVLLSRKGLFLLRLEHVTIVEYFSAIISVSITR